jgi:hypothetical protein
MVQSLGHSLRTRKGAATDDPEDLSLDGPSVIEQSEDESNRRKMMTTRDPVGAWLPYPHTVHLGSISFLSMTWRFAVIKVYRYSNSLFSCDRDLRWRRETPWFRSHPRASNSIHQDPRSRRRNTQFVQYPWGDGAF